MDVPETLRRALQDRYAIERELGQGGMATVYLATDLKHARSVAVKVLRPELSAALGAERFLREIQTTAQLTHPHILPLLDSGAADGTLFYVMPYVEGESLRDRLARERQLPLEEALRITREVADALAYAHGHGVVHRDIKPENILLESGHAVVADFGIARAVNAAGGEKLTQTGFAVGTPAYMSPEQTAGMSDVDGRSDVYALGCVLYELLSGETPYTGLTPQSIFAKKMSEPLPRISVVRESVPAGVEEVLNRALAKTAADRWPTAAAFAEALEHPERLAPATGARTLSVSVRVPDWARWVAAAVVVGAAAFAVVRQVRPRPLDVTLSDVRPVTNEPGVDFRPAISPDGNEVAYHAGVLSAPDLVIRSTAGVAVSGQFRLPDSVVRQLAGLGVPSFRSDGQAVRFPGRRGADTRWWEAGKLGGALRAVTLPPGRFHAWSPDGARVAFARGDSLYTLSSPDTVPRRVAVTPTVMGPLNFITWSPDGKRIAYVDGNTLWYTSLNVMPTAIWVVDAEGGVPKRVTSNRCLNESPAWLDARHLLYVSTCDGPRGVYVVEVGRNGARGAPRPVPGTGDVHTIAYSPQARRLVFSKLLLRQNIRAYPLHARPPVSIRDGRPVTTGIQAVETFDVSPDGNSIAYASDLRGNLDIYKVAATGGEPVALTDDPANEDRPVWSPDGRDVVFSRWGYPDDSDSATLVGRPMIVPSEGGSPSPFPPLSGDWIGVAWAPNGLGLALGGPRLRLLSRDSVGGPWRGPAAVAGFGCFPVAWLRDGSGISCQSQQANAELVVVSPEGEVLWRRERSAWAPLRLWFLTTLAYSPDGREMYLAGTHADGRNGVWAFPAGPHGAPRLVLSFDDPQLELPTSFVRNGGSMSAGRDELYLTVAQYESDIWTAKVTW